MRAEGGAVVSAAKLWWSLKRPDGWDADRHLAQPAVNLSTEADRQLAYAVASMIVERKARRP